MALTERTVVDRIEVLETGHLQVRHATVIVDDTGKERSREYHRVAYAPGDDVRAEDPRVQAVAAAVWTPAVVEPYRAWQRAGTEREARHDDD